MATKVTKTLILEDARAIALTLQGPLTRDFLRSRSSYTDAQRSKFFATHDSLLEAISEVLTPTQRKAGIG